MKKSKLGSSPETFATGDIEATAEALEALKNAIEQMNRAAKLLPTLSGTQTYDFTGFDNSVIRNRQYYFATRAYERKYQIDTDTMLKRWKAGELRGPDITDWLTAYMSVRNYIIHVSQR